MNPIEIILLVVGILCIVVSFFIDPGLRKDQDVNVELDEAQKESVRRQVEDIVAQHLEVVNDNAEAQMDKLSARKIMEVDEFAETVKREIYKNHEEAMFLYDMLNEKAKEVKLTVKDVNTVKKQVDQMVKDSEQSVQEEEKPKRTRKTTVKTEDAQMTQTAEDEAPKKRGRKKKTEVAEGAEAEAAATTEAQPKTSRKTTAKKAAQPELTRNEQILELKRQGLDARQIAKQMGIGVGEVSLILDLYN